MLRIAEVFGHAVEDLGESALRDRTARHCPFRSSPCTKSSIIDPIGVCTLSDGANAAALCPVRFVQGSRMFLDAARLAFGERVRFAAVPEISVLRLKKTGRSGRLIMCWRGWMRAESPISPRWRFRACIFRAATSGNP